MKAIIEFDLKEDLEDALNAGKYKTALWDIKQFIRGERKYKDISADEEKIFCEIEKYYKDIEL